MIPCLEACEANVNIKYIVLKGAGKSFCAGGDLKELYSGIIANKKNIGDYYIGVYEWYRKMYRIATMKIPIIAIIDGLSVGKVVGYSQIWTFKIATENTILSGPENSIGHFCDGGNSFTLSRLDGSIGIDLALTGHSIRAEDVYRIAGLATHFVKFENLENLELALAQMSDASLDKIDATIQTFTVKKTMLLCIILSMLQDHLPLHKSCFKYDSVEEIIQALRKNNTAFAKYCLATLTRLPPTSMKLTLMLIHQGKKQSYAICLDQEYLYWRCLALRHDFRECVEALFEKRVPKLNPSTLEEVDLQKMLPKELFVLNAYPRYNPDLDFSVRHYKEYLLPTAQEVYAVMVDLNFGSNKDVVNWFMKGNRSNKFGLKEKVEGILEEGARSKRYVQYHNLDQLIFLCGLSLLTGLFNLFSRCVLDNVVTFFKTVNYKDMTFYGCCHSIL